MLIEFSKIFAFILLSAVFVVFVVFFAKLVRPHKPTTEKLKTYECGENPEGSGWIRFNIRFYVVALIFLIFDVEVVLLFPWAIAYREYGVAGFLVGITFLLILGLGVVYEWKKGDLEWERPTPKPPYLKDLKNFTKKSI
ncbi:MAG: NADH-quinone oxidoreductase subunit A [bacterium]